MELGKQKHAKADYTPGLSFLSAVLNSVGLSASSPEITNQQNAGGHNHGQRRNRQGMLSHPGQRRQRHAALVYYEQIAASGTPFSSIVISRYSPAGSSEVIVKPLS